MQTSIPSQLLLRLLQASPEQMSAIERILNCASSNVGRQTPEAEPQDQDQDAANRGIAAKILELLTALDSDNRSRKAPLLKVFLLYYRHNCHPAEIARRCRCHRTIVFDRLAQIKARLSWEPKRLFAVSSHVEAMQKTLSDSRARSIYRKGAAYGDAGDDQSDDWA